MTDAVLLLPPPGLAETGSPWKGLAPFEDSSLDVRLFFGREREVEIACANLMATRLTVLFGATGVGKSSLLRAGVMPRLRVVGPEGSAAALVSTWTGDPVEAVAVAVREAVSATLGHRVDDPGGPLVERVRSWTDELGGELYLVLDQLEEEFLYHPDENGPGSFVDEFPRLVTERGLQVHVLIGIREDALGRLDAFRAAIPGVLSNYLRLERLDRDAGRAAILGPIACWNELLPDESMTAEPALVEAVLDEVAAGRIEPDAAGIGGVTAAALVERIEAPYLQLVLERLWRSERGSGSRVLRRETLRELGGAAHIVEQHLDRALERLGGLDRDATSALFAYLVTPSGTKIAHRPDDLASYVGLEPARAEALVSLLVAERILRPAEDGRVEIYHDVLAAPVGAWRREQEAVRTIERQQRAAEARHRRLLVILVGALAALLVVGGVAVYAVSQRNEAQQQAALARESEQEAEEQAARADANAKDAQRQAAAAESAEQTAQASAAEAEEQRQIANEQSAAAEAAALEAQEQEVRAEQNEATAQEQAEAAQRASATAVAERNRAASAEARARREARTARAEAQLARARQLTAVATSALATDPERSVRYALRAFALRPRLPEVETVLRRSLIELRLRAVLPGGSPLNGATFSADSARVVTAGDGDEARVFRASDGARLLRLRHPGGVAEAAFSHDRVLVATAGETGTVVVWRADDGTRVQTLVQGGSVGSVAFSPDGRLLLSASTNGSVVLWDVASGLELRRLPHGRAVRQARFSGDGRLFATQTDEGNVRVWEAATGRLVATPTQQGEVTDLAWSPTGDTLVTTGRRNAYVWSTADWTQRHLLEGHTASIRDVAITADGRRVITAGVDGLSRVWRADTGALLYTALVHTAEVTTVGLSADAASAVSGSDDGTAQVWPLAGGPAIALVGHDGALTSAAFSIDGRTVLTASRDGDARLWTPTGDPELRVVGRHEGGATTAEPDATASLIVSGGVDRVARLWRLDGTLVATLPHAGRVTVARFADRGRRVLTASEDATARLWTSAGRPLASFVHGSPVRAAAVSPDATTVATGGDDGVVRVWRVGGGLRFALRHAGPVRVVAFDRDGMRLLAAGDDGIARLWRVADGRRLRTFPHGAPIAAASFAPYGGAIVTGGADALVRMWDTAAGRPRRTLGGLEAAVTAARFSPDGRLVLAADAAGNARTWNTRTGTVAASLRGHVSLVSDARFSPDGRWIVTAGPSAAGLWETATGELLFYLRGHGAPLTAASFSADGRWIVTAGRDGTVRRHRCVLCSDARALASLARARLRAIR